MLILLGKSSSGKNTIQDELSKLGHHAIAPYSTRPMRSGEVQGNPYIFINNFKFYLLKFLKRFIETTSFKVANGDTWHYGTLKKDFLHNERGIVILNPDSYRQVKQYLTRKDFVVLIDVSKITQRKRLEARGDDDVEIARRIFADANDFVDVRHDVDFVIQNDEVKTPTEIAQIIEKKYRERLANA